MSSWTGIDEVKIKTKNKYDEAKVELWRNDHTDKMEITFYGMSWSGDGIYSKAQLKKVIKFLTDNLDALK